MSNKKISSLALAALGVVYGDIGTSPLYSFKEAFLHGLALNELNILSVLSAFIWSVLLIVTVKYISVVMQYNNNGEGGVLSLLALVLKKIKPGSKQARVVLLLGLFAAGLFYADAFITPAISVLSAIEGTELITIQFKSWIIPITISVLIMLFLFQRYGTQKIGGLLFGPIMIIWFLTLGILGLKEIFINPAVLYAFNPFYAVQFFFNQPKEGIFLLSAVFLALTGGEALYADMGHFGARAIRVAWYGLVWPSLTLNYLGQGALLMHEPTAINNPFFLLMPSSGLIFLVILATCATVIASQATISGTFSLTLEASRLSLLPRINFLHTSDQEKGQVYIPFINWLMLLGVLFLVVAFKSSGALASAYGLAVSGTMLITTILLIYMQLLYRASYFKLCLLGLFLIIEIGFVLSNLTKIATGAWLPILIGCVVFSILFIWQKGMHYLKEERRNQSLNLDILPNILNQGIHKVSGTAIYLTSDKDLIPNALLHNLKHYQVIHEYNISLTVETLNSPYVAQEDKVKVNEVFENFYQVTVYFGFREYPYLVPLIEGLKLHDWKFDLMSTTFFVSDTIIINNGNFLNHVEFNVFNILFRQAGEIHQYFGLPPNRTVQLGTQVAL